MVPRPPWCRPRTAILAPSNGGSSAAVAAQLPGAGAGCRVCGGATQPTELGEALVERVVATGGSVEMIEAQSWLARVQGVAARLRYPI